MIHETLKQYRHKFNYTCLDMAKKLNISKTFYWQLENGKRTLSYKMAYKISFILKTKPDKLFYNHYKDCD